MKDQSVGSRLKSLPVSAALTYFIVTLVIFLVWPVGWQIYDFTSWARVTAYLLLCFLILYVFFTLGVNGTPGRRRLNDVPIPTITIGAFLAIALLAPSTYAYTGKWPWSVFEALNDQGLAYRRFQEQLIESEGERGLISFVRAIASPFIFAVLPLGVLHWRRLTNRIRALVIASTMCTIIFSLMRATDKEFADLAVVGATALAALWVREREHVQLAFKRRRVIQVMIALTFFIVAAGLYSDRKAARLGRAAEAAVICANDSRICVDLNEKSIDWVPPAYRFQLSMFALSISQGYYGLALSMEKDFESTYGFGHSPASMNIYQLITGDRQLITRTYTFRNGYEGWNHLNYWSSLVSWIANDVGFTGALFVFAILSFLWGRTWREAAYGGDDNAAIVCAALSVIWMYFPANNQFFGSYDGYFIIGFWGWRALYRSNVSGQIAL